MSGEGLANMLTEHEEQRNLFEWWREYSKACKIDERLLFAIPVGGNRTIQTRIYLRSEGVRKGTPDLFFAYPSNGLHGLFIEMKRAKGGKLEAEQADFLNELRAAGFGAVVCRGCAEAVDAIVEYLRQSV